MSYEMMELLLVQKVADLRASEAQFAQSLSVARREAGVNLNTDYKRMHSQMSEVEQLLALMETATVDGERTPASLLPANTTGQISSSVWV